MQLAEPARPRRRRRHVAPSGRDAAPDAACLGRAARARRGQRLEVALDVEEIDGALRGRPIAPGAPARRPGRRGAAAASQPRRRVAQEAASRLRRCGPARALRVRLVRSVSTQSAGSSVVRITSRCAAIGFSTVIGSRRVAVRESAASAAELTKLKVIDLLPVARDERALDANARAPRFGLRQHVLHVRARAARESRRSRGCARPPRRSLPRSRGRSDSDGGVTTKSSPSRVNAKPRRVEDRRDASRGSIVMPRRRAHARGAHAHRRRARGSVTDDVVERAGAAAADLDDQLRRALDRARAAAEVDAALEAIARVAGEAEAARSCPGSPRGSRTRLRGYTRRRVVADARMLAAHDAGEAQRLLLVGRRAAGRASRSSTWPFSSVSFSPSRAKRTTSVAVEQAIVVGVQRLAELEHHVVGDVDDRRDRADAAALEALLHPRGRRRPGVDAVDRARARSAGTPPGPRRARCARRRS